MKIYDLRLALRAYPELLKIAKSLHRMDEADCNYGSTPRRDKAQDRTILKARKILADLARNTGTEGLTAYHQGDPRGCSLYVVIPEDCSQERYDKGIAIY